MRKCVVTVLGKDTVGIIAKVCTYLADNNINILDIKYRWGSCTPKDNIHFNWRLIKAPITVIEYIIVHELTHLLESNHTQEFWNRVSAQLPNYDKAKQWLKENGHELETDF